MATWIIALIVVAAVYLAARVTLKEHRSGGCPGCGSCGRCGGRCTEIRAPGKAEASACRGAKTK